MTQGQNFIARNGYSKSTKRLLNKYNINGEITEENLNALKIIRKERKRKSLLAKRNKHFLKKANRSSKK